MLRCIVMGSGILLLLLSFSAANAWGEVRYVITDLGTLGGSMSAGYGINDNGQVVGGAYTADGYYHAFLYSGDGPMRDVVTLDGRHSCAADINNRGQVVGYATSFQGFSYPFLYSGQGPMQNIGAMCGSGGAYSINDNGQVAVSAYVNNCPRSFRSVANCPINPATDDLGDLGGGFSWAVSINSSGQVTGRATTSNGDSHVFFYSGTGPMQDFGSLGGAYSEADDINDAGQIVGAGLTNDGYCHAFCTVANQPINPATDDLGTLGGTESYAIGINDNGQVVGWAATSSDAHHAFLYDGDGPILDLNGSIDASSGWLLVEARDINNSGQIVGTGQINGESHAFLLTPTPEPSTLVLLAIGAVSLLSVAWWRRETCR